MEKLGIFMVWTFGILFISGIVATVLIEKENEKKEFKTNEDEDLPWIYQIDLDKD